MKKEKVLYFIILLLLLLLIYILLIDYKIVINGVEYKQKIIFYLLGID